MIPLRKQIIDTLYEVADIRGVDVSLHPTNDTVLLDSGLDSLGFAILVARLEEDLGFDPFAMMDIPFYPRTLNEFVAIYERFAPEVK
jgi:acyl carrier protein